MDWYRIRVANYSADGVQDAFEAAFMAAGAPKDAALFLRLQPEGADYYVSPGAMSFFQSTVTVLGGQPCPPPTTEGTTFLVGHDEARTMLSAANRG